MALLKLNNLTPAQNPSSYTVTEKDVYTTETQTESGLDFIERARTGKIKIDASYSMLTDTEKTEILTELDSLPITVKYEFTGIKTASMRVKEKKVGLKFIDDVGTCYWSLSFTMEEF